MKSAPRTRHRVICERGNMQIPVSCRVLQDRLYSDRYIVELHINGQYAFDEVLTTEIAAVERATCLLAHWVSLLIPVFDAGYIKGFNMPAKLEGLDIIESPQGDPLLAN